MIQITMPRLSDTMEEGAIAVWHKKVGDRVEVGDVLVEIETDKATMDYEAYDAGVLTKILVPEGEQAVIGQPIAELDGGTDDTLAPEGGSTDAAAPAASSPATPATPAPAPAPAPAAAPEKEPDSASPARTEDDRVLATPLVRAIARERGLDLSSVAGTGPGGRIIRADVDALPAATPATPAPAAPAASVAPAARPALAAPGTTAPADDRRDSEELPLSKVRQVIARRLGESARSIPHFYVTAAADAEELMAMRAQLNEQLVAAQRSKISVNDLLIRASALALREHPMVNASYRGDGETTMLVHHRVNIGVAVAGEHGLVVPVIDDADQKSVGRIGAEAKELVALANGRGLTPAQMSGGTFTISNLGMFGVEEFTAIINPPEGAILAVGGTTREPTVVGDEILPRYRMRYTLSADHRIIDGALAAQFLQTLTRLIENPWTILA